jgi:short-subunit dehydrogenase
LARGPSAGTGVVERDGAKHFLNALTANFRDEMRRTHPGIQFTLVSPGIVATPFGSNAMHGGPDSRQLPGAQTPEEVAAVIAEVIDSRRQDVYTRPGARERVIGYYSTVGEDPALEFPDCSAERKRDRL